MSLEETMKRVRNVITQAHRLSVTPPVDDDFPEVKHNFDSAILDYAELLRPKLEPVLAAAPPTHTEGVAMPEQPDAAPIYCRAGIVQPCSWPDCPCSEGRKSKIPDRRESTSPMPAAAKMPEEPYFIEVDQNGCAQCGGRRTWTVVGPDGVSLGQSWGDEETASDIAEYMNTAYSVGNAHAEAQQREIAKLKALYGSALSDALMKSNAYNDVLDRAEAAEAELSRLRPVVEAVRSGAEWGKWKAWLVNGAPSREEGITAAQKIVRIQIAADNVLASALAAAKEGK